MNSERYPDNQMDYPSEVPAEWETFLDLREDLLLGYTYNTARAYWGDLEDWFWWAVERDKNVLDLTEKDQKQFIALLRRRKYSEDTIRRRELALRLLYRLRDQDSNS